MQVEFALLGFISGYVGLRGKLEPVGSDQDTVKVSSEVVDDSTYKFPMNNASMLHCGDELYMACTLYSMCVLHMITPQPHLVQDALQTR